MPCLTSRVRSPTNGLTTDANGNACLTQLPFGTYTVTEKTAPPGYVLDPTPHTVPVNQAATSCAADTAAKLTVTDTPQRGAIKVTKNSNQTPAVGLQGARFTVTDAGGTLIDTLTTGTDGTARRADLPFGDYTVREILPPPGYFGDSTATRTVSVNRLATCAAGSNPNEPATAFVNAPMGALVIFKTSAGGGGLAGAVFDVAGPVATNGLTTDANGNACLTQLPFGTYTVTEKTAPPGHVLDPTPHTVPVNQAATELRRRHCCQIDRDRYARTRRHQGHQDLESDPGRRAAGCAVHRDQRRRDADRHANHRD